MLYGLGDAGGVYTIDTGTVSATKVSQLTITLAGGPFDIDFNPAGVSGAAYTNNDLDVNSGTTLYDIDTMLDQVVIQSPAGAGLLVATGKLGVDAGADAGFDIYSRVRQGKAGDQHAFAILSVGGRYRVYDVRLSNGEATHQGGFRPTKQAHDIAMPLNQL